jgi:hypothetical protein
MSVNSSGRPGSRGPARGSLRSPTKPAAANAHSTATTPPSKPPTRRYPFRNARLDAFREQRHRPRRTDRHTSPDVAGRGRTRDGRRQPRNHRRDRQPATGESAAPAADQRPPRQRQIGNPPHLPHRHPRGLRTAKFSRSGRSPQRQACGLTNSSPSRVSKTRRPAEKVLGRPDDPQCRWGFTTRKLVQQLRVPARRLRPCARRRDG